MKSEMVLSGDIINANPVTYYHYEPLLHYGITQARSGAMADDAVRTLKDLMHCNYTSLGKNLVIFIINTHFFNLIDSYLNGKNSNLLQYYNHNKRLWAHCTEGESNYGIAYCWNPQFLNR